VPLPDYLILFASQIPEWWMNIFLKFLKVSIELWNSPILMSMTDYHSIPLYEYTTIYYSPFNEHYSCFYFVINIFSANIFLAYVLVYKDYLNYIPHHKKLMSFRNSPQLMTSKTINTSAPSPIMLDTTVTHVLYCFSEFPREIKVQLSIPVNSLITYPWQVFLETIS